LEESLEREVCDWRGILLARYFRGLKRAHSLNSAKCNYDGLVSHACACREG